MKTELEHLKWCLAEEAGEVIQALGKIGRFGLKDISPKTKKQSIIDLEDEMHDLVAVYEMICAELNHEILSGSFLRNKINAKKEKVIKYMGYARDIGALAPIN